MRGTPALSRLTAPARKLVRARPSAVSVLLLCCASAGCAKYGRRELQGQPHAVLPAPDGGSLAASWRLDRSTFDASAEPCDDFYQYVCGGWAVPSNIPPDRPTADWARDAANRSNDRALRELLGRAGAADDPEVLRLRAFFSSCMAKTDDKGDATLKTWSSRIDGIRSRSQLMVVLRELHAQGIHAFFRYSGEPDRTDSSRYRGEIHQGALGLGRGAYSEKGPTADERRRDYRAHVARMFELAGIPSERARRDAEAVFDIEAKLAEVSLSFGDRFDPEVSEHPTRPQSLSELAPDIDWTAYLEMVGHSPDKALNVTSPAYLKVANEILAKRSLADLRAYLRWRFLHSVAPALPAAMSDEHYRFSAAAGVERSSRSDECRFETVKALGVELSRQFSLRAIGPEARDRAKAVAERVRDQVLRRLPEVTWLSPAARAASEEKVRMLDLKIGFPDAWPAVGSVSLRADAFLENYLAMQAFEQRRSWQRATAERRRQSWEMTVYPNGAPGMAAARLTIANGFPDVFTNSMIITAASLIPPLFDAEAPPEVRYGSFGALIGHEIVHILENHEFDGQGALRDTWSKDDVQARERRAVCMVEQANQYVAFETTHLDGKRTVFENVADLSGVAYAYSAMAHELGARVSERGADGLTPAKRFFIAYAQHWCSAERPEYLRESIVEEGHAPPKFRVNAPLANLPAFADAFACSKDAAMVRPASSRCAVW